MRLLSVVILLAVACVAYAQGPRGRKMRTLLYVRSNIISLYAGSLEPSIEKRGLHGLAKRIFCKVRSFKTRHKHNVEFFLNGM